MKVFIDTDVILDFLYQREKFYNDAVIIFSLIEKGRFKGYVSSLIIWNIFYLLSKYLGRDEARKRIKAFRKIINVIPVDGEIIDQGLNSRIKDFEDSIQYFCAISEGVDVFVSRNKKDYPARNLPIMTSMEFVASLALDK